MAYDSMQERIIANSVVMPESECWWWTGAKGKNRDGTLYGRLSKRVPGKRNPVTEWAHREAVKAFNKMAKIKGKVICHKCDNPLCVNPAHLEVGTQKKNIRDCVKRGRHASQREPGED